MLRIKTETAVGLFIIAAVITFFYMSYQIGSFRFDRIKYNTFTVYFNDVSGLSKKADVKISGVKVGWVDALELVNDGQQVKASLMVNKKYPIHSDAYGIVRQEGFLGTKHLELVPGDPLMPALASGSVLTRPNRNPVTVDDMLHEFSEIAGNIKSVVASLSNVLGGVEGEAKIRDLVNHLDSAAEHLASLTGKVDRVVTDNETNINSVLKELRMNIPRVSGSFQDNFDKISTDFNRIATQIETGVKPIRETMEKVNTGNGILGQLVNDETAGDDLRTAIHSVKTYFDKVDKMKLVFDIWSETMSGPMEGRGKTRESKSYANIRLHGTEDYYYLVGIVGTRNGQIHRYDEVRHWFEDTCGITPYTELIPPEMHLAPDKLLKYAKYRRYKTRKLDTVLFNVQFAKVFGNFGFRFGLFDSTGGFGVDIDLPFGVVDLRWVTTFEMYDFFGVNRYSEGDDWPHLKWLNRMFFTKNIYFTFGADDFISKFNKNAFLGIGLRFVDDDIKYLLSRVTILAPT